MKAALGLDFGTESVRAMLVDLNGQELSTVSVDYKHGQIVEFLPGSKKKLPPHYALQHPLDWVDSAAKATQSALIKAKLDPNQVVGVGVDFTSCTMLPTLKDGTPLCLLEKFNNEALAWPKLWKHHGAQAQTDRINAVAHEREEAFLSRYGGVIGLEWFFPKMLETLELAPEAYNATEVWLEAGDWFVWQLVGGAAESLPRSTCQAGYKGMWHAQEGYPSENFLKSVHPDFGKVVIEKMPGRMVAPGVPAGGLTSTMAERFGLKEGTPVSAAIIDAHAGVPGAGAAEAGTLVMVMGTSSCHMLNSKEERSVPGVAGVVKDGILPGFFGYETGQAAVGDAFDWLRKLTGQKDFSTLAQEAALLPPGADGVLCLDWFNGCRTPLMNGNLTGAFTGLAMHHGPAHMYRALLEASSFGVGWIVELLRDGGVPVNHFVATGGLPHHNPLVVQVCADVLGERITVHPSKQGPALGAAILGALAAEAFSSPREAIRAMATPKPGTATVFEPNHAHSKTYEALYREYRQLGDFFSSNTTP
ncbi:MAG: ribulokinase [Verrucomicrobia bacterium]|jgi:L-ribulokinase|nr:ribulokinase [Verrucomicrobiota bacterium]